ncbi:glucose-6-phosphate dehydrogenase [Cellulomonas endophytica]|uniref:glucose-6-phosphate dehydrogenase n=1 Tax=Cellulomonas endophytica TaxID=2494735 RepID=UPI00101195C2|nr:glucose-6-phosphate dehydrogenase [Cellulomonas endophytica]
MPADRPVLLVLHGARGDLARRMVLPALATLHARDLLPARWALLGAGRSEVSTADFRSAVSEALETFGDEEARGAGDALRERATYARDVSESDEDDAGDLPDAVARARRSLGDEAVVVHYLAVPPESFEPLTRALHRHGLVDGVRVVYEKPYGTSPESFRALDAVVHEVLDEEQVFRIDHFLGKEATQNLHVVRFANELVGGAWNREHVAQVQVDVPETLDVADRAEFYDATGALLDMLVTHLFQVAATVAMEPPAGLSAGDLAAARDEALEHFRPLTPDDVVLGQFEGYREIDGVDDASTTDTFVAARLYVDTDRWRGVPFLLRTGKRMAASAQQVTLVLRRPDELFGQEVGPNQVAVSLAGSGEVRITTTVKRPGPDLVLDTGTATLALADVEPGAALPPYAGLLADVLAGDRTLFTTPRGLAAAWRAVEPVLGDARPQVQPYAPDGWGPGAAEALAAPGRWALGPADPDGTRPTDGD